MYMHHISTSLHPTQPKSTNAPEGRVVPPQEVQPPLQQGLDGAVLRARVIRQGQDVRAVVWVCVVFMCGYVMWVGAASSLVMSK